MLENCIMLVSIGDKTIIRLTDPWSPEFINLKKKKKKKKNSSSLNVWWVPKITP